MIWGNASYILCFFDFFCKKSANCGMSIIRVQIAAPQRLYTAADRQPAAGSRRNLQYSARFRNILGNGSFFRFGKKRTQRSSSAGAGMFPIECVASGDIY